MSNNRKRYKNYALTLRTAIFGIIKIPLFLFSIISLIGCDQPFCNLKFYKFIPSACIAIIQSLEIKSSSNSKVPNI
ncbi:hypothetical protein AAW12_23740 [Sphingobacterium sp. Ag1]|nr:hypothetical protein AAW12_23740 [Sphingobacterium sp. Ag1]